MLAMKCPPPRTQGFTLIELLVVIALISILASLAAPDFRRSIAQRKVSEVASDLMISTLQARSAAITNNQQAIVQPLVTTDWSRGWRIYVDVDKDKAYTAGTDTLISTVSAKAGTVTTNELSPSTLTLIGFNSTGYLLESTAGRVVFSTTAIPSNQYKKGIVFSRTGRVRICETNPSKNECSGSE